MRHAGAQAARDVRQMRIGIARLDRALLGVQIGALIETVVLVAGPFRKQRAEGVYVGRNVPGAQTRGEAAIEEAGGRVKRPVKTVRVGLEGLVLGRETRPEINDVEARSRCE